MAQFGAILPGFSEKNENTNAVDPETPLGRKPGEQDPPNTGGHSQSEAVRLARRGGSVAPPITDPEEKRGWIPGADAQAAAQLSQANIQRSIQGAKEPTASDPELHARTEGRKARDQGKPISDCPYPADTKAQYQWISGWMQPKPTDAEDAS